MANAFICLCQKNIECSPVQLNYTSKLLIMLEQCRIMFPTIMYSFACACAYLTNKGLNHFLIDIKVITVDLALINPEYNCN